MCACLRMPRGALQFWDALTVSLNERIRSVRDDIEVDCLLISFARPFSVVCFGGGFFWAISSWRSVSVFGWWLYNGTRSKYLLAISNSERSKNIEISLNFISWTRIPMTHVSSSKVQRDGILSTHPHEFRYASAIQPRLEAGRMNHNSECAQDSHHWKATLASAWTWRRRIWVTAWGSHSPCSENVVV